MPTIANRIPFRPHACRAKGMKQMTVNKRSEEVPTEQAPKDGPLTQLVEDRVRNSPDNLRPDEESAVPRDIHKPTRKEYAEGTAEHDDDREV